MKSAVKILSEEKAAQRLDSLAYDIISVAWLEESSAKKSPRDILNYYKILIMHKYLLQYALLYGMLVLQ